MIRLLMIEIGSEEYTLMHYFNIRSSDLPQLIIMDMYDEEDPKRFRFVDYLANRKQYYSYYKDLVDEHAPIESPSNLAK